MPPDRRPPSYRYTCAVVAISSVLGAGGGFFVAVRLADRVAEELALRPRVVVVDYGRIADTITPGTRPEEIDQIAMAMRSSVATLAAAGFLVLDAAAVHGVPPELVMPVPAVRRTATGRGSAGPAPPPLAASPPVVGPGSPAASRPAEGQPR